MSLRELQIGLPLLLLGLLIINRFFLIRFFLSSNRHCLLFITRAFIYPRSTLFDGVHQIHNLVVILVNVDRRLALSASTASLPLINCLLNGTDQRSESALIVPAKLEQLHVGYAHAPCRLAIMRIVCHPFPHQIGPDQKSIGLQIGQNKPIELKLTVADQTVRQLVMCPGRLFLFDQWHLLITSMELNRLHRVDLVMIHVQSIHPALIPILRHYEREGLARVRPSLRMPSSSELIDFDPNQETLWNNQLVNFHDCLYQFKESASFIAFNDWDDLLISPASTPLPSALHQFVLTHPEVGALIPKRFPGYFPTLAQMSSSSDGMSMPDLFEFGVRFSVWPSDAQFISKVLVRSRFVSGVELHGPGTMASGFTTMELPPERAFFIHARDYQNPRINQHLISTSTLSANLATFLGRHNVSLSSPPLPSSEHFLSTLNRCLSRVEAKLRANRHSKCFNYAHCRTELERRMAELEANSGQAMECVGADNRWSVPETMAPFRASVLLEERLSPIRGLQCLP